MSKWHTEHCKNCGTEIYVLEDWSPPYFCKPCREHKAAQWYEKPCLRCGRMMRVNQEWSHIPNYCKDCKAEFARERESKYYEKACLGCRATIRVDRDWAHPPNYCPNCKASHQANAPRNEEKTRWVDKNHYRVTSKDGRRSYLYKTDGWTSVCVGITDHHPDGETQEYEVDYSLGGIIRSLFTGERKGKLK